MVTFRTPNNLHVEKEKFIYSKDGAKKFLDSIVAEKNIIVDAKVYKIKKKNKCDNFCEYVTTYENLCSTCKGNYFTSQHWHRNWRD